MYAASDNKITSSFFYFLFSTILHGLAFYLILNANLKIHEAQNIKKNVIEFELATAAVLISNLPLEKVSGAAEKEGVASEDPEPITLAAPLASEKSLEVPIEKTPVAVEPIVEKVQQDMKPQVLKAPPTKVQSLKPPTSQVAVAQPKENLLNSKKVAAVDIKSDHVDINDKDPLVLPDQELPVESTSDFEPTEDFKKIDLKGKSWSEDNDSEKLDPDLVPKASEQNEIANEYSALNKTYKTEDLESDLSVAEKKNHELAISQGDKVLNELEKDAKSHVFKTEKFIESEKRKKFVIPAKPEKKIVDSAITDKGESVSADSSQLIKTVNSNDDANFAKNDLAGEPSDDASDKSFVAASKETKGSSSSSEREVAFGGSTNAVDTISEGEGEKTIKRGGLATNQKAGGSSEVRELGELRQMKGNKKPEYTIADRRAGNQGDVVYHAFINKDGYPERFLLIKSSNYQSLDKTTLDALKKWKFYPGQEGWVELPFHWSLKGGAVEAPSFLRR